MKRSLFILALLLGLGAIASADGSSSYPQINALAEEPGFFPQCTSLVGSCATELAGFALAVTGIAWLARRRSTHEKSNDEPTSTGSTS